MARLETFTPSYQSNAVEVPIIRKWIVRALILSLLLHGGLYLWFRHTRLERFAPPTERLVPRMFTMKTVQIDAKLLEGEDAPPPKAEQEKKLEPKQIDLPKDEPSVDKIMDQTRVTPVAPPDITKPIAIAPDKPRVEPNTVQSLANLTDNAARMLEKDLAASKENLLKEKLPKTSSQAMLKMTDAATGGVVGSNADAAGLAVASKRLDALLGGSGLTKGDAPLSLPGGALFEFGSWELKSAALVQLGKLAQLIKKNPNVMFSIEGHTDSFGDEQTNVELSRARAESVRNYLVQRMDVDPTRIEIRAWGKSKLAVQPKPYDERSQASIDAEKARQQPNRRVEIVFRFPKSE